MVLVSKCKNVKRAVAMSPVIYLSLMVLFALQIGQSQSNTIPPDFKCEETEGSIYSTGDIKVDLTHIFCGQIKKTHDYYGTHESAHGFHALIKGKVPKTVRPGSLIKPPCNPNDFAVYKKPEVSNGDVFLLKGTMWPWREGISGIWPTAMTVEEIVLYIEHMVKTCG